jgi:hypothetical protein
VFDCAGNCCVHLEGHDGTGGYCLPEHGNAFVNECDDCVISHAITGWVTPNQTMEPTDLIEITSDNIGEHWGYNMRTNRSNLCTTEAGIGVAPTPPTEGILDDGPTITGGPGSGLPPYATGAAWCPYYEIWEDCVGNLCGNAGTLTEADTEFECTGCFAADFDINSWVDEFGCCAASIDGHDPDCLGTCDGSWPSILAAQHPNSSTHELMSKSAAKHPVHSNSVSASVNVPAFPQRLPTQSSHIS